MLDNIVLNVAISLVFIFLLYSLLATILMELIASIFDFRSRMLLKSIKVMLEDRRLWSQQYHNWFACYIISPLERIFVSVAGWIFRVIVPFPEKTLAEVFYRHPNIKYLSESIWNNRPSYISSTKFAETLTHILRGASYGSDIDEMQAIGKTLLSTSPGVDSDRGRVTIGTETLQYLRQIYYDAKGDSIKFRALLENWYSETSERTTGWYKRQTQYYLLIVGMFIAYQFNVDTLTIYNVLAKNDTLAERMADLASKAPEKYDAVIDSLNRASKSKDGSNKPKPQTQYSSTQYLAKTFRSLESDAQDANLVMGLGKPYSDALASVKDSIKSRMDRHINFCELITERDSLQLHVDNLKFSPKQKGGVNTFAGWAITALAISLGAPFWFDLLNKLVSIRNAGKNPEKTHSVREEKDKIPEKYRVG